MNFKATKTPLLIAAMAAAVMLTTFGPANASVAWSGASSSSSAQLVNTEGSADVQVIEANFKRSKLRSHHSYRNHRSSRSHRSFNRHKKFRGRAFDRGHSFKRHDDFRHRGTRGRIILKKRF